MFANKRWTINFQWKENCEAFLIPLTAHFFRSNYASETDSALAIDTIFYQNLDQAIIPEISQTIMKICHYKTKSFWKHFPFFRFHDCSISPLVLLQKCSFTSKWIRHVTWNFETLTSIWPQGWYLTDFIYQWCNCHKS